VKPALNDDAELNEDPQWPVRLEHFLCCDRCQGIERCEVLSAMSAAAQAHHDCEVCASEVVCFEAYRLANRPAENYVAESSGAGTLIRFAAR
jgi:hypothetical protein